MPLKVLRAEVSLHLPVNPVLHQTVSWDYQTALYTGHSHTGHTPAPVLHPQEGCILKTFQDP